MRGAPIPFSAMRVELRQPPRGWHGGEGRGQTLCPETPRRGTPPAQEREGQAGGHCSQYSGRECCYMAESVFLPTGHRHYSPSPAFDPDEKAGSYTEKNAVYEKGQSLRHPSFLPRRPLCLLPSPVRTVPEAGLPCPGPSLLSATAREKISADRTMKKERPCLGMAASGPRCQGHVNCTHKGRGGPLRRGGCRTCM